jgi:hypothetical protein
MKVAAHSLEDQPASRASILLDIGNLSQVALALCKRQKGDAHAVQT